MSPGNNYKLTTVILTYAKAVRAVESVGFLIGKKNQSFQNKIIVVDNSCDEEKKKILASGLEKFHNSVKLVFNKKNIGYSRGYNIATPQLEGEYVLVLNPDILFRQGDSLEKMIQYMDNNPDVAILGPKQINDDGTVAMTVRAFPKFYLQVARRTFLRNLPILKEKVAYDEMRHLNYDKIQDVDWLQSSCVLIRRDFWEKVGGYNEYYFLFMADAEMCLRAWEMGYRVVYYPQTQVYADGKRLSAGGFGMFFKSWFVRQHVIDSLKYRTKNIWKGDTRKKYYKKFKTVEKVDEKS